MVTTGPRPGRARPRAAGRRRPRHPAPPDRRRLAPRWPVSAPVTLEPPGGAPLPSWPRSPGARALDAARLRRRGDLGRRRPSPTSCPSSSPASRSSRSSRSRFPSRWPASRTPGSSPSSTPRAGRTSCARRAGRAPAGEGPRRRRSGCSATCSGHDARDLPARTGLVLEPGRLGTWLVGPAGALLVRRGRLGRPRVDCWCVRRAGPEPAHGGPHLAPPPGAPRRRGRPGHRGQPRLLGRSLAGAPPPRRPAAAGAGGGGRRRLSPASDRRSDRLGSR